MKIKVLTYMDNENNHSSGDLVKPLGFVHRFFSGVRKKMFQYDEEILSFSGDLIGLFLIALLYYGAYSFGIYFTEWTNGLSSLWPASGVGLALLILNPKKRWWKIICVYFAVSYFTTIAGGYTIVQSLAYSFSGAFESYFCVLFFRFFCKGKVAFDTEREIIFLFLVAILGVGTTALVDTSISVYFFGGSFFETWILGLVTNGMGIVLLTPLIVTWVSNSNELRPNKDVSIIEIILLFITLIVLVAVLFSPLTVAEHPLARNYMLFPVLIWLALRSTPKGMITALFVLSVCSLSSTLFQYGIFSFVKNTREENLISAQFFVFVMVFSSLMLSIITSKLKEKDKLTDDYLAITAHELKSPLVPIKSQAQILLALDYGALNKEQKDAVEMIYRNEESLARIVGNILDVAKIRSSKLELKFEEVDFSSLIAEVIKNMQVVFQEKNISLFLTLVDEKISVTADKMRIEQVLRNLLMNAFKFTGEGGVVTVSVKKTPSEIIVLVKDNGCGISLNNLEKIFKPFFQVESSPNRKNRGNGLGLPLCKGIIEGHNGKIWVESLGEGKGSTFGFTLPAHAHRTV